MDLLTGMSPWACFITGAVAVSVLWMAAFTWAMDQWSAARWEAAQLRLRTCACHVKAHHDEPFRKTAAAGYYVRGTGKDAA
jgi:hypothetical protein